MVLRRSSVSVGGFGFECDVKPFGGGGTEYLNVTSLQTSFSCDPPILKMKKLIEPPTVVAVDVLKSNSAEESGGSASGPLPRLCWYCSSAAFTRGITKSSGPASAAGAVSPTNAAFGSTSFSCARATPVRPNVASSKQQTSSSHLDIVPPLRNYRSRSIVYFFGQDSLLGFQGNSMNKLTIAAACMTLGLVLLATQMVGETPNGDIIARKIKSEVASSAVTSHPVSGGATVDRLMAPEYVYIGPNGQVSDRSKIMGVILSPSYKLHHVEWTEVQINLLSDSAAVIIDHLQGTGTLNGNTFTDNNRCSRVCLRRNGAWQIVFEQASEVRAAQVDGESSLGKRPRSGGNNVR